jgi:hypothetical protein
VCADALPQNPAARTQALAELEGIRKRAARLSPAEYQLRVAHLAALAGNGHTMLVKSAWPHAFNRIPLRLHRFADGLFVIHAPDDLRELIGARVVSIDGRDLSQLERVYRRYDGARESKRAEWIPFFLESPALLHGAGVADRADQVELRLDTSAGARVRRILRARLDPPSLAPLDSLLRSRLVDFASENLRGQSLPLYLGEPDRMFRANLVRELGVYYVQLRANASCGKEEIQPLLASLLSAIRTHRPRHLVIDLRFDGGGDLNTTREFFQTLPALIGREGRVFATTSGRTFSAGITSLGYLKQAGTSRVTIVGEPVGDRLEFWAEGHLIELPISKALLLSATERHNYRTGCPQPDCHVSIRDYPIRVHTLDPDVGVASTYGDLRAGRDAAPDAIRRILVR